jgi:hypothetical protein
MAGGALATALFQIHVSTTGVSEGSEVGQTKS